MNSKKYKWPSRKTENKKVSEKSNYGYVGNGAYEKCIVQSFSPKLKKGNNGKQILQNGNTSNQKKRYTFQHKNLILSQVSSCGLI